ncbi:MAG: hypothetical protein ACI9UA_004286, partial [Pseudoalteromonas tetraodonis]
MAASNSTQFPNIFAARAVSSRRADAISTLGSEADQEPRLHSGNVAISKTAYSSFRAPPKTSCGLELDEIPDVFVAK